MVISAPTNFGSNASPTSMTAMTYPTLREATPVMFTTDAVDDEYGDAGGVPARPDSRTPSAFEQSEPCRSRKSVVLGLRSAVR